MKVVDRETAIKVLSLDFNTKNKLYCKCSGSTIYKDGFCMFCGKPMRNNAQAKARYDTVKFVIKNNLGRYIDNNRKGIHG